jgi:hypothetical protein
MFFKGICRNPWIFSKCVQISIFIRMKEKGDYKRTNMIKEGGKVKVFIRSIFTLEKMNSL